MSENKQFFSVVIPLYNKRPHICRSVFSVLNQSYDNFELIVVDDGSTDGSLNEINEIEDKRLRIFEKENGGVSSARNFGIKKANADYVAFLDADDEWSLDFLKTISEMYNLFPNKGMYATAYKLVSSSSEINKNINNENQVFEIEDYFQEFLKLRAPVNDSSATVIRRDLLFTVGLYPEDLNNFEDWTVSFKVALYSDVIYSTKVLSSVHLDTVNRISQGVDKYRQLKSYDKLIVKIEEFILKKKLKRGNINLLFESQAKYFMKNSIINKEWEFFDVFKKTNLYKYTRVYQRILYVSKLNRITLFIYKVFLLFR